MGNNENNSWNIRWEGVSHKCISNYRLVYFDGSTVFTKPLNISFLFTEAITFNENDRHET